MGLGKGLWCASVDQPHCAQRVRDPHGEGIVVAGGDPPQTFTAVGTAYKATLDVPYLGETLFHHLNGVSARSFGTGMSCPPS